MVDKIADEVEQAVATLSAGEAKTIEQDDVLADLKEILPKRYHRRVEEIYRRGSQPRESSGSASPRGDAGRLTKVPGGKRSDPREPALARS